MNQRKALFLDRDGVINEDGNYVYRPEDFHFLPDVFDALRAAQARDYLLIVITNQSGIGRGLYTETDFHKLTDWMLSRLKKEKIEIASVYFDPTHPTDAVGPYKCISPDRKPAPGMILKAAAEHDIDLVASALIGDQESDIEAGRAAGVGTTICITNKPSAATHVAASLDSAIALLMGH